MRITDALVAMKAEKKKINEENRCSVSTIWSEQAKAGETLMEYPRPQLQREQWVCLNGYWQYAFTRESSRPDCLEGQILVPFSPETARSGVERCLKPEEYLWYFRSIMIPEIPEHHRLLLHFGAVDERCVVWWNGRMVGSHRNGYLPFSFDVTEQVREGKNTIWVRVQDDTDTGSACRGKQTLQPGGMFYTAQSGIWQTVWMEWVPDTYVEQIRVTPLLDEKQIQLNITLSDAADTSVIILGEWGAYQHRIKASEYALQSGQGRASAEYTLDNRYCVKVKLDLPELHPWTPETPYLYDLQIQAGEDRVSSYFAMRKYSIGTDRNNHPRLMLNNKPYFFNGVLDQGYWPESLYTAPSDEAMIFDIESMKKAGFNMMRKHIKIEPLRWYYHCDRIGMTVWQDMVNGGGKWKKYLMCYVPSALPFFTSKLKDNRYRLFGRSDAAARTQWEEDCMMTVDHLYNCPCISMWVPFNEGWGQFDAVRISGKIRQADPTRQIDHASGWYDQGCGDVKSIHNYFRKLKVKCDWRPFVISEYGGFSCRVEGHISTDASYGYRSYDTMQSFAKAFELCSKKIKKLEAKGLSGAVYTQVSDVEGEINGLLTFDRKISKI